MLIVDDEPKLLEVIKAYMDKDGWQAIAVEDGETALQQFHLNPPDLVILDIMLGDMSGIELAEKMRVRSSIPFIMITSKSREEDRLNGFYLGADDYVVKPFSTKELVARANAVYRRSSLYIQKGDSKRVPFDNGALQIDYHKMEVFINDENCLLTNTEYKLFSAMSRAPGKEFSRAELLYYVQGYRFVGDSRSIDAHVKNIRQKIEKDPKAPRILTTVVGVGYKIAVVRDD